MFSIFLIEMKENTQSVLQCVASSLFTNAAYLHASGEYRTVLADVVLHVHPHSVLYTEEKAPWSVTSFYYLFFFMYLFLFFFLNGRRILNLAPGAPSIGISENYVMQSK